MQPYTTYEIEVHRAGKRLQESFPSYMGLKIQQLQIVTGFSWGTVCNALSGLEEKGKAVSDKTKAGNRKHGSIRFKGRIPVRRSA